MTTQKNDLLEKYGSIFRQPTVGHKVHFVNRGTASDFIYRSAAQEVEKSKHAKMLWFSVWVDGFVYESIYPAGILRHGGGNEKLLLRTAG